MARTIGDIFDDLYDRAAGVFDRVVDLELADKELAVAQDVQLFRSAQAADDQTARDSVLGTGFDKQSLLIFAAIGVLAIFALRG